MFDKQKLFQFHNDINHWKNIQFKAILANTKSPAKKAEYIREQKEDAPK